MSTILPPEETIKFGLHTFSGPKGDHIFETMKSRSSFYEEDLLQAVYRLNLEGTYVDVGANLGNHSLFFGVCCRAKRLVAIEPLRSAFHYLVKNVSNVVAIPVEFVHCAVSDHSGRGSMRVSPNNLGMSQLSEEGDAVSIRTLDDIVCGMNDIVLIKIDVEGDEAKVLRGAAETIKRCHPVLIVEAATGEALEKVNAILEPLGYLPSGKYCATPTWLYLPPKSRVPRVAVMATLRDRVGSAKLAIDSIKDQVDRVEVVLNRKQDEDLSLWKSELGGGNVVFHVRDNQKGDAERYIPVGVEDTYYLSIDDDLIYPAGYVDKMVEACDRYACPVTLHGKYFPMFPVTSYHNQTGAQYYACRSSQKEDVRVHVPGTGVMCWKPDQLDLRYDRFVARNRADLEVARIAAAKRMPIMCLAHEPLVYTPPVAGTTIWDSAHIDEEDHVREVNSLLSAAQRISVSMIVKNEELCLEKALKSVAGADELVVVDTGSTDSTKEIAARFGAKIHDFPWIDDFSAARNHSLSKCTGDWILIIDADEELEPGGLDKIRKAISESGGFKTIGINCAAAHGKGVHVSPRVFRRIPEIFWCGAIHNYINVKESNPKDIKITYGYSAAHKNDPDRALRILLKELNKNPELTREKYYLAREYWYRKDYATAAKWYTDYVQHSNHSAEQADGWLMLARCLWMLRKAELARDACLQAIKLNANFKEAELFMADMSGPGNKKRWLQIAETATNEGVLFVRT